MIDCLTAESFYTKYEEFENIGDSLQMKTRWGEVNIRNIHFSLCRRRDQKFFDEVRVDVSVKEQVMI